MNLAGSSIEADFIAQREQMQQQQQRLVGTGEQQQQRPNTLTVRDQAPTGPTADRGTMATLNTTELLNQQGEITMKDVVLEPQEILALYASPVQVHITVEIRNTDTLRNLVEIQYFRT